MIIAFLALMTDQLILIQVVKSMEGGDQALVIGLIKGLLVDIVVVNKNGCQVNTDVEALVGV